jgi:hypothetical protein
LLAADRKEGIPSSCRADKSLKESIIPDTRRARVGYESPGHASLINRFDTEKGPMWRSDSIKRLLSHPILIGAVSK